MDSGLAPRGAPRNDRENDLPEDAEHNTILAQPCQANQAPPFPTVQPSGAAQKNFRPLLKPKAVLLIFFSPPNGGVRAPDGPGSRRRAPVVSGAARNHLALWRIWICALTTSLRCGVRPSASTAFSTSPK